MTEPHDSPAFVVPALVRQRAEAHGAAGRQWLSELPAVVTSLAAQWELSLGSAYDGGTTSLVVATTDARGRACALKIAMALDDHDRTSFRRSVIAHDLADGRGCARLYAHDDATSALLLEGLGRNLAELEVPLPLLLRAIADTLQQFWRPVPEDCDLPSATDRVAWLANEITTMWDGLGQPCSRAVVDRALDYCAERSAAFDPNHAVLVHGDAHGWNTLDAGAGTYKFIDPEGVRSEPAHDLGVPMREYNGPLLVGDTMRLVRERAELLAGWCAVDPEAVWQWGFIDRVATGLSNVRDFENDDGAIFLEVATRCL
ncbi:MAG: aminoglycoside phosphotransferase family protein [Actinomycetota bacterium]|nr:aminoglycoside phosphotransferase family protein [Actinomycetota bacterium]